MTVILDVLDVLSGGDASAGVKKAVSEAVDVANDKANQSSGPAAQEGLKKIQKILQPYDEFKDADTWHLVQKIAGQLISIIIPVIIGYLCFTLYSPSAPCTRAGCFVWICAVGILYVAQRVLQRDRRNTWTILGLLGGMAKK